MITLSKRYIPSVGIVSNHKVKIGNICMMIKYRYAWLGIGYQSFYLMDGINNYYLGKNRKKAFAKLKRWHKEITNNKG